MTNALISLLTPLFLASAAPDDALQARARIEGSLEPGATARLVVKIDVKDGWSMSKAGIPNAIVQVDVPKSAVMIGERASTKKELSKAGFIRHPEERFADGNKTTFEFKLMSPPDANDRFAVNILAYVSPPDGSDAWFVRRRIALPVADGAKSVNVAATRSDWGVGDELQLGDKAPLLKLPRADGTLIDLGQHLGKRNILITTYRAFW